MARLPQSRIEQVVDRFDEVEARMGAATEADEIVALSKEHADLKSVADKAREVIAARAGLTEAEALISGDDKDLAELAREEALALKDALPALEKDLQLLLLPKDEDDKANIVLEVRAGTGGDEAALFAGDLFRMYQRFAQLQGWKVGLVSVSDGDAGGYKEITANISGDQVFGRMKWESGVHRVQRVPQTETQGRIHTSAATVAVLPAPENVEIDIKPDEIRIDTMRASGSGGQHVNTTDSAVRITHLPTGIMATSSEKSQHVNREKAMEMLKIRLYEREREEKNKARADARKSQVGSGDRSEKIRTYNYPQGRVSDHRINLTLHNLDKIISGDALGDVIDALRAEDQALKLAAMDAGDDR
ncbi:MAG: peptide chain release factor 1 [Pseudomonadota bacterium]